MCHVFVTHGCVFDMLKSQSTFPKSSQKKSAPTDEVAKTLLDGCWLCDLFSQQNKSRANLTSKLVAELNDSNKIKSLYCIRESKKSTGYVWKTRNKTLSEHISGEGGSRSAIQLGS